MSLREQEHRRQRKLARRKARVAARTPGRKHLDTMRRHRTLGSAVRHTLRGYRPPDVLLDEMRHRTAAEARREAARRRLVEIGSDRMQRMVAREPA